MPRLKTNKQLLDILNNLYFQIYAKIGKDWNEMKASGETQKDMFFMEYLISQYDSYKILDECTKGLNKYQKNKISVAYHLGCSPVFKQPNV